MTNLTQFKSKRHNATSLQSIEVSKYTVGKDASIDPTAYSLQLLLVSHYDASSKSGVLNPLVARVMHQLRMDEHEFATALAHLLHSRDWQIATATTTHEGMYNWQVLELAEIVAIIESIGVHNVTEFMPLYLGAVVDAKDVLRKQRVALNHLKFLTRYTAMPAGLGQAMQTLVATVISPNYQDLGYSHYIQQGLVPKFQLPNSSGQLRKLCHSVWFDHPLMKSRTESDWAYLFGLTAPTDDMLASPMTATVPMRAFANKFTLANPIAELRQAIMDINTAGWFHVAFSGDKTSPMEGSLTFTPTKKLHHAVWDLENQPGGSRVSGWEIENGYLPAIELVEGNDPMVNLPKIGYHWLYGTKSHKTGEWLSIGQTTVSLKARLYQHKTYGSNANLHAKIENINMDPQDQLIIVPIGLVHHSVCAEMEMRALWKMREKGHRLYNVLDNIERNRSTIALDARLQALDPQEAKNILEQGLATHGAMIFQRELPEYLIPA